MNITSIRPYFQNNSPILSYKKEDIQSYKSSALAKDTVTFKGNPADYKKLSNYLKSKLSYLEKDFFTRYGECFGNFLIALNSDYQAELTKINLTKDLRIRQSNPDKMKAASKQFWHSLCKRHAKNEIRDAREKCFYELWEPVNILMNREKVCINIIKDIFHSEWKQLNKNGVSWNLVNNSNPNYFNKSFMKIWTEKAKIATIDGRILSKEEEKVYRIFTKNQGKFEDKFDELRKLNDLEQSILLQALKEHWQKEFFKTQIENALRANKK